MKVVLAGGSGFLGAPLRAALNAEGHTVVTLTRRTAARAPDEVSWSPDGSVGAWARVFDDADAVVNLAGEGIADHRWTAAHKEAVLVSRLNATHSVVAALAQAAQRPRALVSASGVGYYGFRGDEIVTEATSPGTDFLARVCVAWEAAAAEAGAFARVSFVRSGLVLHTSGGALAKMLLPFKLGVGGPHGSGRQLMPWIHRDDWVGLVRWLIVQDSARGPFNATAPEPVTNKEFARALGRALGRPAILPVPALALRVLLGEISDALVTGQRAMPTRALEMGFQFKFRRLEDALRDLLE
jgi:uncharacterized protein (TIGR01777 family)